MAVGIPLLFLLPLFLLGGLAAVVFGIVYAIVNKRPGVAMVAVLMPVVLLISIAFVGLGFGLRANVATRSAEPAQITWAAGPSMPPMPAMPSAPHINVNGSVPSWVKLAVLILIVVGMVKLFSKRSSCDGKRRGWGWALVVVAILAMVYFINIRRQFASVAQHEANVQLRIAQRIHASVEADPGAQQVVDEVAQRYGGLNQQSIQAIWEQLNQPRINLDADQHGASLSVGAGANQLAVVAPEEGGAKLVVPVSDKTPESLSRSLTRLERMIEQVSAVADRLSDAGTLIGKGMVALSDSTDSRSSAKSSGSNRTGETAKAVSPTVPAAQPAPAAIAAVAVVESPIQQTIEIQFDQQKMNQFNLSYAKIKDLLGHDGFWRGTMVRYVPDESRIVVTGELEDDYVSRLRGTLVDTVGRQHRPVHLSDVATITARPEGIGAPTSTGEFTDSPRPSWIYEPPKNFDSQELGALLATSDGTKLDKYMHPEDLSSTLATQRIEFKVNEMKLRQLNQSVEDITRALGECGFWGVGIGTLVGNERSITAIGDPKKGIESKLLDIEVGTTGEQQHPIHLRDVATMIGFDSQSGLMTQKGLRPAWIDEPPKNIGNVRRQVIVAGDFVTLEECNREADRQLYLVTLDHLKELCGDEDLDRIREFDAAAKSDRYGHREPSPAEIAASTLNRMGIGIDFIRREIAKKEYVETVERSVGPMKKLHVQVEFSPSIDLELRQRWDEVRRQDRFAVVGAGAGSVLGLLGLVFGLLKVDTWTKGYYTKRLFFGVPAAIIGLIALLMAAG